MGAGLFHAGKDIRSTVEYLIDNARVENEMIHCGRVVNNINPNLIFTRSGEYVVMSPSAQRTLNDLHADAGVFAEEHQEKHYTLCMKAALESGFFDGRISHMRILRPWLRGKGDMSCVIDIVWTPIVLSTAEIVVESNFRLTPSGSRKLEIGESIQLTPKDEATHSLLRPVLVPRAAGSPSMSVAGAPA